MSMNGKRKKENLVSYNIILFIQDYCTFIDIYLTYPTPSISLFTFFNFLLKSNFVNELLNERGRVCWYLYTVV